MGKLSLSGLENGTYTLTLRGAGFATYTQSFEVNGLVYEMQLYTDQISGFQSGKAPGVLLIGDVNASGTVDGTDLSSLIDVLESDGYDGSCDLNGDGTVDLLDLQLLAGSYNTGVGRQAFLSTRLPVALAQTAAGQQTQIQGDVNLENTAGAITPDTPAVLDFDFAGEDKAPVVMEGMSIQSPLGTDNTVTQATIHVVYEDADGVEREMDIPVSTVSTLARLGGVQQQADAPWWWTSADRLPSRRFLCASRPPPAAAIWRKSPRWSFSTTWRAGSLPLRWTFPPTFGWKMATVNLL